MTGHKKISQKYLQKKVILRGYNHILDTEGFATDFIFKTKTALLELDKSGRGKWVVEKNIFQSHSNHWIFLP